MNRDRPRLIALNLFKSAQFVSGAIVGKEALVGGQLCFSFNRSTRDVPWVYVQATLGDGAGQHELTLHVSDANGNEIGGAQKAIVEARAGEWLAPLQVVFFKPPKTGAYKLEARINGIRMEIRVFEVFGPEGWRPEDPPLID